MPLLLSEVGASICEYEQQSKYYMVSKSTLAIHCSPSGGQHTVCHLVFRLSTKCDQCDTGPIMPPMDFTSPWYRPPPGITKGPTRILDSIIGGLPIENEEGGDGSITPLITSSPVTTLKTSISPLDSKSWSSRKALPWGAAPPHADWSRLSATFSSSHRFNTVHSSTTARKPMKKSFRKIAGQFQV